MVALGQLKVRHHAISYWNPRAAIKGLYTIIHGHSKALASLLHLQSQKARFGTAHSAGIVPSPRIKGIAAFVQLVHLLLAFFLLI